MLGFPRLGSGSLALPAPRNNSPAAFGGRAARSAAAVVAGAGRASEADARRGEPSKPRPGEHADPHNGELRRTTTNYDDLRRTTTNYDELQRTTTNYDGLDTNYDNPFRSVPGLASKRSGPNRSGPDYFVIPVPNFCSGPDSQVRYRSGPVPAHTCLLYQLA